MKKKKLLFVGAAVLALSLGISVKTADADVDMLRLYNPNSGEHFYTAGPAEKDNLVKAGWEYEGIGWVAPDSGTPVYRLYNPNAGDHFYTLASFERDSLVKAGWKYEGVGWQSGGSIPLLRAYNPNAKAGAHNYTTGSFEQSSLLKAGWRDEGIAWYGVGYGKTVSNPYARKAVSLNNQIFEVGYEDYAEIRPGKYIVTSTNPTWPYVISDKYNKEYTICNVMYDSPKSLTINFESGDTVWANGGILLTPID